MKINPSTHADANINTANHPQLSKFQQPEEKAPTRGQRLADILATKVGSWPFLIGQTVILAGWVGSNLTPGLPHWDESPFILLNLVFSFASAYTAPIVLMSQNRQSDIDRQKAEFNHQVNLKAAYDLELLHEKIDTLAKQIPVLLENQYQQSSPTAIKLMAMSTAVNTGTANNAATKPLTSEKNKRPLYLSALLPQGFKSDFDSCKYVSLMPGVIPTQNSYPPSSPEPTYFNQKPSPLVVSGLVSNFKLESRQTVERQTVQ